MVTVSDLIERGEVRTPHPREKVVSGPENRLREVRMRYGVGMQQVADATGYSAGHLSRVERRITEPSVTCAVRLARFFEMPVEDLFLIPAFQED